ncbi:hypothetical protein SHANETTE_40 [Bacillus phage Shanette]|uniref:Lipoprotein n=1 Tax=Bacillus phage Shanette TaxID=1296656 RepID=S5MT30_9CAUD|nr:hypothetical protein AVV46_gp040 [Bacillus phage Shanette]AGR46942.1 hypothetical protein SHANETTE_40 [Bacillus phage Shanette]
MKKTLLLIGCVMVLGACDPPKPPEYKETPQGFKPIGQYEESPYRTIKLEDKETTCRYLITDDGYITPDLVQPTKCKGLMKGE